MLATPIFNGKNSVHSPLLIVGGSIYRAFGSKVVRWQWETISYASAKVDSDRMMVNDRGGAHWAPSPDPSPEFSRALPSIRRRRTALRAVDSMHAKQNWQKICVPPIGKSGSAPDYYNYIPWILDDYYYIFLAYGQYIKYCIILCALFNT